MPRLTLVPLEGLPRVRPGDDLAALLLAAIERAGEALRDGDLLALAQKVVSKAEGRFVALDEVSPSARARELAVTVDKDPRVVELILRESRAVVRAVPGVLVVEHRLGFLLANAGIDHSNVEQAGAGERVLLLPEDPDRIGRRAARAPARAHRRRDRGGDRRQPGDAPGDWAPSASRSASPGSRRWSTCAAPPTWRAGRSRSPRSATPTRSRPPPRSCSARPTRGSRRCCCAGSPPRAAIRRRRRCCARATRTCSGERERREWPGPRADRRRRRRQAGARPGPGAARPEQLLFVVNTGDDFEHLGLHVSPDLDTLMYTLSGLANPDTGWGRVDETWQFIAALERLGGETWFNLGDRDLAVHVERTRAAARRDSLLSADHRANSIPHARRRGIRSAPMSDEPLRDHRRTPPAVDARVSALLRARALHADGARVSSSPAPRQRARLPERRSPGSPTRTLTAHHRCARRTRGVSIDPILAVPGVRDALRASAAPVVAVSPIVAGLAIKGPTAKMMAELGVPASAVEVARRYGALGILDRYVLDEEDRALAPEVEALGVEVAIEQTVMRTLDDKVALARRLLDRLV
jgi:LPPG:FO 2-phospho-L-lactate transferase